MPLDLSIARVTSTANLPEDQQVFVIKNSGTRIGEVSCLGGVWAATFVLGLTRDDIVVFREKTRERLLETVRSSLETQLEKRSCMGFSPGEHVLYRDEAMFFIIGTDPKSEKLFLGYEMGGKVHQEAHPTDLN